MRRATLMLPLIIAACGPAPAPAGNAESVTEVAVETPVDPVVPAAAPVPAGTPSPAPLNPPAPGTPGGLPDDRTPVEERSQPDESGQGAARVVERYYGLIEAGRYREAYELWAPGRAGMTAVAFARSFDRYAEYHANIGAPGAVEGAAGSRYVTVPVQPYGRLKDGGRPFHMRGEIVLRRVAEVPGSTAAQRRWHIDRAEIKPAPGPGPGQGAGPKPRPQPTEDNRSTAQYRCEGGVRLSARFDPDNGVVTVIRRGAQPVTLQQRRAGSGIWYQGSGHELRGKGADMTFTAPGKPPLSCVAQLP